VRGKNRTPWSNPAQAGRARLSHSSVFKRAMFFGSGDVVPRLIAGVRSEEPIGPLFWRFWLTPRGAVAQLVER
jgi:hypothetical protein